MVKRQSRFGSTANDEGCFSFRTLSDDASGLRALTFVGKGRLEWREDSDVFIAGNSQAIVRRARAIRRCNLLRVPAGVDPVAASSAGDNLTDAHIALRAWRGWEPRTFCRRPRAGSGRGERRLRRLRSAAAQHRAIARRADTSKRTRGFHVDASHRCYRDAEAPGNEARHCRISGRRPRLECCDLFPRYADAALGNVFARWNLFGGSPERETAHTERSRPARVRRDSPGARRKQAYCLG